MDKKYAYHHMVETYIARMVARYEGGYVTDNTIPYHRSDDCPRCKKPFGKDEEGTLNAGSVLAFLMDEAIPAPLAIIYCLCLDCTADLREKEGEDPLVLETEQTLLTLLERPLKPVDPTREKRSHSYKLEELLLKRGHPYRRKGYTLDRIILDSNNDCCFFCEASMKEVLVVNFYCDPIRKIAYPYGICKTCQRNVQRNEQSLKHTHSLLTKAEEKVASILYL